MALYRYRPAPSGRMGALWALASVNESAVLEFGVMGHNIYAKTWIDRAGVRGRSKLYCTHMDEIDVSLGTTDRIFRSVDTIVEDKSIKAIFFLPSSIPEIIGTDLKAIAGELQSKYPDVQMVPFGYGGFEVEQEKGVEQTLLTLAKKMPVDSKRTDNVTFNIIGSCADVVRFKADADELCRIMKGAFNADPVCIMTSEASVTSLRQLGNAHINLVIRREGVSTGKYLERTYGTPYIHQRPYGFEQTEEWVAKVGEVLNIEPDKDFLAKEYDDTFYLRDQIMPNFKRTGMMGGMGMGMGSRNRLSLGGHPDIVKGISDYADYIGLTKGYCWTEHVTIKEESVPYFDEDKRDEIFPELKEHVVMANGDMIGFLNANPELLIAYPTKESHIYQYEPPFMGYRGGLYLASLWTSEIGRKGRARILKDRA